MVQKIIWAPSALEDLRDIVLFIRRDNPEAALKFGRQLIEKAETLSTFPERGRVIRKFANPDIREIFLGSYRIAYRIKRLPTPCVEIVRIWHGARSEENLTL